MATFVRPADAYRARHRASPGDAERALAELSLRDEGVASASLAGLPDDLWRRIKILEPEGLERTFANQSKELMFITQDAVRSRLRKLY